MSELAETAESAEGKNRTAREEGKCSGTARSGVDPVGEGQTAETTEPAKDKINQEMRVNVLRAPRALRLILLAKTKPQRPQSPRRTKTIRNKSKCSANSACSGVDPVGEGQTAETTEPAEDKNNQE
jgi:hypothetical protein